MTSTRPSSHGSDTGDRHDDGPGVRDRGPRRGPARYERRNHGCDFRVANAGAVGPRSVRGRGSAAASGRGPEPQLVSKTEWSSGPIRLKRVSSPASHYRTVASPGKPSEGRRGRCMQIARRGWSSDRCRHHRREAWHRGPRASSPLGSASPSGRPGAGSVNRVGCLRRAKEWDPLVPRWRPANHRAQNRRKEDL